MVWGCLISAAGRVGVILAHFSVIVIRHCLLEIRIFYIKGVIVHHIHIHADAILMKRLHHLLHLLDAHLPVIGICAVGALRHIVILRIIPPVKLRCVKLCLIYRGIVVARENLHMCHTQVLDVIDSRREPVRIGRPCLCQPQKLSRIADSRRRVRWQIPDVKLIDHRVRGVGKRRSRIVLKSLRIGGVKIHHHTPVAVDSGRPRIEIHRLIGLISDLNGIRIIYSVQIALFLAGPHALLPHCHGNRLDQIIAVPLLVQI